MTRFVDSYLLYLLAQASSTASAGFHAELAKKRVPVATWRILASLYPDASMGVSALAKACLTKQSTMTRQIDRLQSAGLVTRSPTKTDRRRVHVQLTPQGHNLAHRLIEDAKAHESKIIASLSAPDISALKAALAKLTAQ